METSENKKSKLEQAGEDLFNYAIDREDVKWLIARLPETADIQRATVEYELQLLKIITVGWSLSFYLENSPHKTPLSELYWKAVHGFSQSLSSATGLMTGHDINYFQTLKERLDMYVDAMAKNPDAPEPAQIIGPEFAGNCGNREDLFTFMTGSKMFVSAAGRVQEYLKATRFLSAQT